MGWFLGFGVAGLIVLALSLVFDGFLESVGGAFDGFLDGFLSLPVIAGFVSALGFAGAIATGAAGAGAVTATLTGVAAGALVGWLTWRFSRALLRDGDASAPRGEDLTGTSGAVVTAIPAGGYGEVLLYLAGQPVKYAAKSAVPVERGSEVWVESVLSPTSVTVRPVER
ncbi:MULTISPECIES: hypothetical protein [Streptomyces]|uniref:NfeD-like C-terminal domain-containing protein n=1 Tax=Streptomyces venezuelae (strain ATCC 10712 / CBS 650.69 / DSM 40230 / JCM 4526 / NBRC 13096 / PD 04745) TaxID=953739 RepID=F2R9L2_STRVP|nr:hypothetical protein [Streptomyces venezuelae]APE24587.1 hypothetical protein vnz_28535 [Streptomyces venezuelae]QES01944.1 hypothetical protein DEJ43_28995 [Streptomyces venezuelae ATCC 10712]CCA59055.1 hypothetical protein SVEN_5769 [Streptomyces venezuelae ATCC 10712]